MLSEGKISPWKITTDDNQIFSLNFLSNLTAISAKRKLKKSQRLTSASRKIKTSPSSTHTTFRTTNTKQLL